jgi:hypothetical protein
MNLNLLFFDPKSPYHLLVLSSSIIKYPPSWFEAFTLPSSLEEKSNEDLLEYLREISKWNDNL